MKIQKDNENDEILAEKREKSLITVSFLAAINENLDPEKAFKIASDAFANYMISLYEDILASTEEYSQERFDCFRKFYEDYSKKTPYLKIIESTPKILRVKYLRCPFYEILEERGLEVLAYAFCLSDLTFTKKVLPGVKFSRNHEIARGGPYCDNTWEFNIVDK